MQSIHALTNVAPILRDSRPAQVVNASIFLRDLADFEDPDIVLRQFLGDDEVSCHKRDSAVAIATTRLCHRNPESCRGLRVARELHRAQLYRTMLCPARSRIAFR